ncbi:MAG TPA: alpha/beta hydrolase [Bacillales bacterium]|nr:alpha/beta hydrolase [Bacillales bacterium]
MEKASLLLLPGTLCNQRLWAHQMQHLSDIADVKVPDLTRDDSIEDMARTVLREAPDRFALAGLSMGGIVSLEIMRQAPERVTALALLDSNPLPAKQEQKKTWDGFIAMAREGRFLEITEKHLLPTLIRQESINNEKLVSTIIKMAKEVGKEAMIRQMTALKSRPDAREVLGTISCPTLVMLGRQDVVCPLHLHELLAENIPDAHLVIVEESGHLSSLEQPQAVTAVFRYWLQRSEPSSWET